MMATDAAAPERAFPHLAEKHHDRVIETMPGLSGPPQKAPRALDGFGLGRIRSREAAALGRLPSPSSLHARKSLAFIGPCGIGETHLARAHGRECRPNGHKTCHLRATELGDELKCAAGPGCTPRLMGMLVRPSCPIVDEIGRCACDHARANPSFDAIDRRHEEDGPDTMILTSNVPASNRDGLLTGDDTLPCAPGRLFDRATAPMMRGAGSRGAEPETLSVETAPLAPRVDEQGERESRRWRIGDISPAAVGCLNATGNGYLSPTPAWLD